MRVLLLVAFLVTTYSYAQTDFIRKDSVPVTVSGSLLHNAWAGGINFPLLSPIDLNDDGKEDIFLFDRFNNRIQTYINNGSTDITQAWTLDQSYASQFPPVNFWALLKDYNCDGRPDFFTLSPATQSGIAVYRNDGGLQWTLITSVLEEQFHTITQNVFANSVSLPAFDDVDGDGDMDILGYSTLPDGRIVYHKNYSMENYGVCDSLAFKYETGCWGNFALLIGGDTNRVNCFHCPCREARPAEFTGWSEPVYDASEAARLDDTISSIYIIDLDGDNDKDLLVGDIAGSNTLMIRNGGTAAQAEMDIQDIFFPSYDVPIDFSGFHYHAYLDADNDGVKDLVAVPRDNENTLGMWLYKNTGTDPVPVFEFFTDDFLQGEMIDVGENACPVLFDADADGLDDMLIGSYRYNQGTNSYVTSLTLYRNTGTSNNPAFEFVTGDYANLSSFNYISPLYPAFGDMDADGDQDMVLGSDDGRLKYFTNTAGAGNPAAFSLTDPWISSIDVGQFATPQLVDLNRDGLLDIVCGEASGILNYFENTGTASSHLFTQQPTIDTLGCILINTSLSPFGYTVPYIYDSLGQYRLLLGTMKGNVYYYNRIDGNLNQCFDLKDSLFQKPESSRLQFNVTVSGGDLNGDGFHDILVGHSAGGVELFYQQNPVSSINEYYSAYSFSISPNPASDKLRIETDLRDARLEITDVTGRVLKSLTVIDGEAVADISEFSSGVYIVRLAENAVSGKKFIVSGRE